MVTSEDIERLLRALDESDPFVKDRLAREMFAERVYAHEHPGGIETSWAADGRTRGEYHDCAARAIRALLRIARKQQMWDWQPPAS